MSRNGDEGNGGGGGGGASRDHEEDNSARHSWRWSVARAEEVAVAEEVDAEDVDGEASGDSAARRRRTLPRNGRPAEEAGVRTSLGFEAWKRESLAAALARSGMHVPARASKAQLVNLARERFDPARRALPLDSDGNRVRYTSQQSGVKYVQGPMAANTERISSVPRQAELYFSDEAAVVSTEGSIHRAPPANFRTMRSLSEGEFAAELQEIEDELDIEDMDEEEEGEAQETLENRMRLEFSKPSQRRAKAFADLHHPRNREGKPYPVCGTHTGHHCPDLGSIGNIIFCSSKPESELARYGAGISLYFKWLKWLTWMFLFLSILAFPQIYLNCAAFSGSVNYGIGALEATMLSSMASADLNQTLILTDEQLSNVGINIFRPFVNCDEDCAVNRENLGYLYMGLNFAIVGVFVIGVGYLSLFEAREQPSISRKTLTVDEYTVQVVRTPDNASEEALKQYFAEITGEPVHEVIVAHNSGKLISLYVKRGRIIHKLWKAASKVYGVREKFTKAEAQAMEAAVVEHRRIIEEDLELGSRSSLRHSVSRSVGTSNLPVSPIRRSESVESFGVHSIEPEDLLSFVRVRKAFAKRVENLGLIQSELRRAVAQYDKLYADFEEINIELQHMDAGDRSVSAFVTFETQVGFLRCLDLAETSRRSSRKSGKKLIFDDKPVRVRPAPPPSTIIWEHFDFDWWQRFRRRCMSTMIIGCVLAVSIITTYVFSVVREVVRTELTKTECIIPANFTSVDDLAQSIIEGDYPTFYDLEDLITSLLECTCGLSTFSEVGSAALDPDDPCYAFWSDKVPLFGYTFMLSIVIAVTNFSIRAVMAKLITFEKHHSLIGMQLSLSRRVLVTLIFNTGLILFLINEDYSLIGLGAINEISRLSGYRDFTMEWYADVGLQIIFIMLINVFAPQAFIYLEYAFALFFKRNVRCRKPTSQRELNEWNTGPTFLLHYRIAQNLMTVFVTFLYGPGMPVLYPLAALAFLVYYWTDKYFLLRYYRTPPRYDSRIWTKFTTNAMLIAVIPNAAFAVWMYSTPGIFWFPSEDSSESLSPFGNAVNFLFGSAPKDGSFAQSINQRITLPFIAPIVAFFLIYSFFVLLLRVSKRFRQGVVFVLNLLSCGFISKNRVKRVNLHPPISYAKRRGIVSGLPSYSILRNPIYANAFGIDENYAKDHTNVSSMKDITANQLPTLPVI
ncbi:Hypothetical Protein FCC1311_094022 [Hondaea fermentalgiana]|uniref:CSC1/OSCA1-like cytosolic domain-containing protein n=1 Tax=Hondaea fermentalgiana TaxID=2315210 RepID=A0A2R5GTU9_9STRA|nr:Hypothetical Protein FCC1311_094022 [Hondaea fermentalgiana]|eukprot:GBG33178.1 Hypothetical Protein FCC1311_094022 [Hondaea fermentalgiana]